MRIELDLLPLHDVGVLLQPERLPARRCLHQLHASRRRLIAPNPTNLHRPQWQAGSLLGVVWQLAAEQQ
jgi:hypothetical protein